MSKVYLRNDKKLISSWAMYDWANSVYSLTIATAIFPIYYMTATGAINNGLVHFMGRDYLNIALYSYALSVSFLIVALIAPLLSSIADFRGNKLSFMKFFCYLGSSSCIALFWFTGENIHFGIFFFVLASIGFAGSIVYYNAFLKEIVDEKDQDRVSARGFSMGYIGSVILLIVNLVMIIFYKQLGFADESMPTKISFVAVGIWWAGFAQITFYALKRFKYIPPVSDDIPAEKKLSMNSLFGGYQELRKVWNQLRQYKSLKNYLVAFFFYNSAVQTVMYLATIFAKDEIKLEQTRLIMIILIIQLVAVAGAYLFSRISNRYGNIRSLNIAIIVWICVCIAVYQVTSEYPFYGIAFVVGMVMGGIQSMSRSTYSKLVPPTKDTASFFSFYDVTEKLATVFGTAIYGLILEITGNMRNSVLALILFFIVGIIFLYQVKKEKSLEANPNVI
ncbi:MAG: MFS transporter [Chitinophagaceae bacterium]|nr:MFS transporter [Chitinophagaceae bacterium]